MNELDFRIPKKQTAPVDKASLIIGLIDQRQSTLSANLPEIIKLKETIV
jgi:hypothetical protein